MSAETCQVCGSRCCQYFCFEIDEPDDYDEFEDVRWYICHQGVSVHIDDGSWFISILNPCNMLDSEGRCSIYDDRPLICRKYDLDNCDQTSGDYGYEEDFKTGDELMAYARKLLGEREFDYQRAKHRAKLGGENEKALYKELKKLRKKDKGKSKAGKVMVD